MTSNQQRGSAAQRRERQRPDLAAAFAPDRVACIWLPGMAVQAERARRPELAHAPLILTGRAETGEAVVVRDCAPEAQMLGVRVGMPAHSLPRRCPDAVFLPFDTRQYQRRYEEVRRGLDAVSPLVEVQPFEVFYLDLTGLPGLDQEDAEPLAQAVRAVVPRCFSPRVGVAAGKFTAWVAAHSARPLRPMSVPDETQETFLSEAPSSLLPVDAEIRRRLDLMGLRKLGQIARLPRAALLAQFGWQGERLHQLACGEDREPLTPYREEPVVREALTFPEAGPTVTYFYLGLRRLLERICARPERRGRGVRQVRLEACMESGEVWERTLTLRQPTEHWEQIFAELRRRLESVLPVGALTELAVELTAFAARVEGQKLLFPDIQQHRRERLAYELGQLRERLGSTRVYRVVEVEPWSRLPEKQHALLSYEA